MEKKVEAKPKAVKKPKKETAKTARNSKKEVEEVKETKSKKASASKEPTKSTKKTSTKKEEPKVEEKKTKKVSVKDTKKEAPKKRTKKEETKDTTVKAPAKKRTTKSKTVDIAKLGNLEGDLVAEVVEEKEPVKKTTTRKAPAKKAAPKLAAPKPVIDHRTIIRSKLIVDDSAFKDAGVTCPIMYDGAYVDNKTGELAAIYKKSIMQTDAADFINDVAFAIHNRIPEYSDEEIKGFLSIKNITTIKFEVRI